jgi:3-dehydroquinate synthase class II
MTEFEDLPPGFYGGVKTSPDGSVLHKDIREVKDGIENLTQKLDEFTLPTTVSVEVQADLDLGKRICVRTTRMLTTGETPQEGHERLYRETLESLARLIT